MKNEKKYNEICARLGADPSIHFVQVTNRGTITFTTGKPDEILWLLSRVREVGLTPAKSLVDRVASL